MAVPKRRKSKATRDSRRANHKISAKAFNVCQHCGAPRIPHRVCNSCGVYKNAQVFAIQEVETEA
jgi:large subunit ribosomal protein L32